MQVTARWQLARGINLVVAACEMAGMLSTNVAACQGDQLGCGGLRDGRDVVYKCNS